MNNPYRKARHNHKRSKAQLLRNAEGRVFEVNGVIIASIYAGESKSRMISMMSEVASRFIPYLVTKCLKLIRRRRPSSPTFFHFTVIRRDTT